jgi:hypothetical protein
MCGVAAMILQKRSSNFGGWAGIRTSHRKILASYFEMSHNTSDLAGIFGTT